MAGNKSTLEWFRLLKENSSCTKCPASHPAIIEFHHTNPKDKHYSISNMVHNGMSITEIEKELKKTIPLCKNCHAMEHWDDYLKKTTKFGNQMAFDF